MDTRKYIAAEKKRLLAEREEIRSALLAEDVDPVFVGKIQHCIRTVLETGETVERQEAPREQGTVPEKQTIKEQEDINSQHNSATTKRQRRHGDARD